MSSIQPIGSENQVLNQQPEKKEENCSVSVEAVSAVTAPVMEKIVNNAGEASKLVPPPLPPRNRSVKGYEAQQKKLENALENATDPTEKAKPKFLDNHPKIAKKYNSLKANAKLLAEAMIVTGIALAALLLSPLALPPMIAGAAVIGLAFGAYKLWNIIDQKWVHSKDSLKKVPVNDEILGNNVPPVNEGI